MECKVCGRYTQNEDANFCDNCGNSFRENYQNYDNKNMFNQRNPNEQRNYYDSQSVQTERREEPVSFKNWLITLALPILLVFIPIPFLGPIIYVVLLFVWAFGNNTNPNKRNWARANLLVTAITFVISIIFVTVIFTALMDGTFPLDGLEGFEGFENFEGFGNGDNFY